jgi:HEAT repeat protein
VPLKETAVHSSIGGPQPDPGRGANASREATPAAASADAPPPDLNSIRQLAASLARASKMVALYPPASPTPVRAIQYLRALLNGLLERHESIRFVVGRARLFFNGVEVLVEDEHADSFSGRLFRERVRELTFHRGLTDDELTRFLALFRTQNTNALSDTDDLGALIWEADFRFITHFVADDLCGLTVEGVAPDANQQGAPVPDEFELTVETSAEIAAYQANDTTGNSDDEAESEPEEATVPQLAADTALYAVTDDERRGLLSELAAEESHARQLEDFRRVYREVLARERNAEEFSALLDHLKTTMQALLAEGELAELRGFVELLHTLPERCAELAPPMKQAIASTTRVLWDAEARASLVAQLDAGNPLALEGLATFCGALPEAAVDGLCQVLGELRSAPARKRMIAALVARAAGDATPFLRFLDDSRWYVARNVALMLGAIGDRRAAGPLSQAACHSDFRVRREALAAIEQLDPSRAGGLFVEALEDPDERMRVFAALSLAARGVHALEPLLQLVGQKQFAKREAAEIRSVYEALARAGRERAVPYLAEVAKRKNPLRLHHVDEIRAAACDALGWTGSPEAAALLSKLAQDPAPMVREAAQRARERRPDMPAESEQRREVA